MFNGIKARITARQHDGVLDSGDVVQVTLLIAGFVMIAIVLIVWLGTATLNRGADSANCVEIATGSPSQKLQPIEVDIVCGGASAGHSKEVTLGLNGVGKGSSFKKDQSYTNRY